jgi:hypothetical protein
MPSENYNATRQHKDHNERLKLCHGLFNLCIGGISGCMRQQTSALGFSRRLSFARRRRRPQRSGGSDWRI